jgi:hypothetical protein
MAKAVEFTRQKGEPHLYSGAFDIAAVALSHLIGRQQPSNGGKF